MSPPSRLDSRTSFLHSDALHQAVLSTFSTRAFDTKPVTTHQIPAPVFPTPSSPTFISSIHTRDSRLPEAVVVPPPISSVSARLKTLQKGYQQPQYSFAPFSRRGPLYLDTSNQPAKYCGLPQQQQQQQQQHAPSHQHCVMYQALNGRAQGHVPPPSYSEPQVSVKAGIYHDNSQSPVEALHLSHGSGSWLSRNALGQPSQSPVPAALQGDVVLPGLMINAQSVDVMNQSMVPRHSMAQELSARGTQGRKGSQTSRKRSGDGHPAAQGIDDVSRRSSLESNDTALPAANDCQPVRRQRKSAQDATRKIKRCQLEESASDIDVDDVPESRPETTRHKRRRADGTCKVVKTPTGTMNHAGMQAGRTRPHLDGYGQLMRIDGLRQVGPCMGVCTFDPEFDMELNGLIKELNELRSSM